MRCVLIGGRPDHAVAAVVQALGTLANQDVDVLLILQVLERRPTVNATLLAPVIQRSRQEASAALGFHQLLEAEPDEVTDEIDAVAGSECVEELG